MAFIDTEEAGDEGSCSGTLIAPNMVLTAGHCVVNQATNTIKEPEDVEVLIGSPSYLTGGRWYEAKSLYVDPLYRLGSTWHDAGLIELPGPVPAPTIELSQRAVPAGTGVSFLGWGSTLPPTMGDGVPSTELMIGHSVVQATTYCSHFARFYPGAELCSVDAPTYQSALCFGDSGGPTFVDSVSGPVEVGINDSTLGEPGCSATEPSYEVRADVEAPWVYRTAEEHEPALPTLTRSQAIHDVFDVLRTGPIRGHFNGRYQYGVRCEPVESTKMQCEPEWGAFGNDYYGTVTIYLVWEEGEPVWNYRYRISWERDSCVVEERRCHVSTLTH